MPVTEAKQALGSWSVQLKANTPKKIIDLLTDQPAAPAYFGHIAIHTGGINPKIDRDALLRTSRYTGVYRGKAQSQADDTYTLSGVGMSVWLGDEDGKGQCLETQLEIDAAPFPDSIRALLPTTVHEGTLFSLGGATFSGTFQYVDPRTAIKYVCDTIGAEYRVNGDATIDAGAITDLYRQIPICALVKRDAGRDMKVRALAGGFSLSEDVNDFTTRVVLLAQGEGAATATGSADILTGLNPYKDLWGNTLQMTRLVSESTTDTGNADARAQLNLNQYTSPTDALTLSTTDFDIKGDLQVGDNIYVHDPDQSLVDNNNEIIFRGRRINPIILRCTEVTWPVGKKLSIMYRSPAGVWTDLTPWVIPENTSSTTVVVNGYNRSLVSTSEPIGSRPVADASVPDVPTWGPILSQTVYQSPLNGQTRGQVELSWIRPTNTDGTPIIDGDHYEIRYRNSTTPIKPVTYAELATFTYAQLNANGGTFGQPIHYSLGTWQTQSVPFDVVECLIQELAPTMPYEAQIRAVDAANPPNSGAWSDLITWQTADDILPPATPAPPEVAASLIAVQVTHTLGVASGGTFNESLDLHHLEVHGSTDQNFIPSTDTLLGKLIANSGMITGQIPVVGTFPVGDVVPVAFRVIAVDNAGNKSSASTSASVTAQLIDDEHISSLTVSKVTAGTISADFILAGSIKTGVSGARVEMNDLGIQAYDESNHETLNISDADGSVRIRFFEDDETIYAQLQTFTTQSIPIGNGTTANDNVITLDLRNVSGDSQNGGYLWLGSEASILGQDNGTSNYYVRVFNDGSIRYIGQYNYGYVGPTDAEFHYDSGAIGPGITSFTYTYGITCVTNMRVHASPGASTPVGTSWTASGTSSAVITFSAGITWLYVYSWRQ